MHSPILALLLLTAPPDEPFHIDVRFEAEKSQIYVQQYDPVYLKLTVHNDSDRQIVLPSSLLLGAVKYEMRFSPGKGLDWRNYWRSIPGRYTGEHSYEGVDDYYLPPKSKYVVFEQLWFDYEWLNQPLLSETGVYWFAAEFWLGPPRIQNQKGERVSNTATVWLRSVRPGGQRTDHPVVGVKSRPEDERAFLKEFFQIGKPADERVRNRRRFVKYIETDVSWEDNNKAIDRLSPGPLRRRLRFNSLIATFNPKGDGPNESGRKELDELLNEAPEIERAFLIIEACRSRLQGWKQYDLMRHLVSKLPDVRNPKIEWIHKELERVGK